MPEHETDEPQHDGEIWPFEGHPGFRRAIESAGAVAAPLLAGFSFTLFVLLLPSLGEERTTLVRDGAVRVISEHNGFSGAPELAAGLLLLAGLLFVFSVQSAIGLRYHDHRPFDLAEWYPEYFPQGPGGAAPKRSTDTPEWSTDEWPAVRLGDKWYGGWPRRFLSEEIGHALRYAKWMRWLYHAGILALLTGLTALVWPPSGDGDAARWAITAVGGGGVAVEAVWIASKSDTLRATFSKVSFRRRSSNEEGPRSQPS